LEPSTNRDEIHQNQFNGDFCQLGFSIGLGSGWEGIWLVYLFGFVFVLIYVLNFFLKAKPYKNPQKKFRSAYGF
jgi:hypothetical protein